MPEKRIIKIKGMHCASCATLIEKKLRKVPGVINANVNFATEKASVEVEKNVDNSDLHKAVKSAGYDVIENENNEGILKLKIEGMDTKFSILQIKKNVLSKYKEGIIEAELNFILA